MSVSSRSWRPSVQTLIPVPGLKAPVAALEAGRLAVGCTAVLEPAGDPMHHLLHRRLGRAEKRMRGGGIADPCRIRLHPGDHWLPPEELPEADSQIPHPEYLCTRDVDRPRRRRGERY